MKKDGLKKVISFIIGIILGLILVFNTIIIFQSIKKPDEVPSFLGYKPFIVASSSMEKAISKGDLLIVKKEDTSKIKVGDIVAYRQDKDYIVHRVFKINNDDTIETKGDNNNEKDDYVVNLNAIEGVYQACIPHLGNVLLYLSKPESLIIFLLIISLGGTTLLIIEEKKK